MTDVAAFVDLAGQVFGRLTVVRRGPNYVTASGRSKSARWHCRCECGTEALVMSDNLRSGRSTSCGCLTRERSAVARRSQRKAGPSYRAAHTRVQRDRGKAESRLCTDCGRAAREWSYDGTDPEELTTSLAIYGGPVRDVAYSADPVHYSPRCIPCHRSIDRRRTAGDWKTANKRSGDD